MDYPFVYADGFDISSETNATQGEMADFFWCHTLFSNQRNRDELGGGAVERASSVIREVGENYDYRLTWFLFLSLQKLYITIEIKSMWNRLQDLFYDTEEDQEENHKSSNDSVDCEAAEIVPRDIAQEPRNG